MNIGIGIFISKPSGEAIPANAILDENGDPIRDQDGNIITDGS